MKPYERLLKVGKSSERRPSCQDVPCELMNPSCCLAGRDRRVCGLNPSSEVLGKNLLLIDTNLAILFLSEKNMGRPFCFSSRSFTFSSEKTISEKKETGRKGARP